MIMLYVYVKRGNAVTQETLTKSGTLRRVALKIYGKIVNFLLLN